MKIQSPHELLVDQLRDLFSVETQVSETMPELAALSPDPALRNFLATQEESSLVQIDRIKRIAGQLTTDPYGDACKAMKGLIEGGNQHIADADGPLITSLILIAHVNRIIGYQIAGYEVTAALAKVLGISYADTLLSETLSEEREAAEALMAIGSKIYSAVESEGE